MISIRPYLESDLEACRLLYRDLVLVHRDLYDDPTLGGEHSEMLFDHYLEKYGPFAVSMAVAEYDAQPVGFSALLVDGKQAEVEPLIVSPEYRYRGVGRALLEFIIEEAKKRGLSSISVKPVARNLEAMACFHSAGFRKLGQIEMVLEVGDMGIKWRPGISLHGRKYQY